MTDYAVIVLGFLAKQAGTPMSAAQVSVGTRLPEPTVQKVLKLMAGKKLITAQRGASGGYLLPLSLDCMNVYDVVVAIEGPIELDPCAHDGGNDCILSKLYSPASPWNKVNIAIKETLKSIKLTELITINHKETKERA